VFFVSHNMGAVTNLCTRGLVLDGGRVAFAGSARDAVGCYNQAVLRREGAGGPPAHVLDDAPADPAPHDFPVTRLEVLDPAGRPKPELGTWDDVVFRITYWCGQAVRAGSVELAFASPDAGRLLLLSTQPDGTLPLRFTPGEHKVDCLV